MALANELTEMSWLGFTEYGLGQAHFVAGRYREAEACLNRAIARFVNAPEKVPPGTTGSSLLILCYMMKSIIYASIGEFDEFQQSSSQASDLAQTSGRPYDLIAAGYSRGVVQTFQGNLEEAESVLDEAASLSRENEVRLFLPLVLCALGNLYLLTGRAADARDILLKAKDEAETLGHAASIVLASVYLATAYAHLGDIPGGLDLARACQAGARQKGYQKSSRPRPFLPNPAFCFFKAPPPLRMPSLNLNERLKLPPGLKPGHCWARRREHWLVYWPIRAKKPKLRKNWSRQ